MVVSNVASIVVGGMDSTGARIETVYAKVVPMYAVYRTSERVVVQYADDPQLGSDQRQALIASNPLKGEINGLIDGWRKGYTPSAVTRARLFDRRVADALVVGLQGGQAQAVELLTQVKSDIVAERTSIARTTYLFTSCLTTLVFAMLFNRLHSDAVAAAAVAKVAGASTYAAFNSGVYLSAAVGALGAFFSIAMAIRQRQIGTNLQWLDNHTDAALRVTIGVISSAVLYWLLEARFVTFGFGGAPGTGASDQDKANILRAITLVAAFAAGFTERLVGDLLGRAVLSTTSASSNPLAGKAPTTGAAAALAKTPASEVNPMGKPAAVAAGSVAAAAALYAGPPDADDQLEGCLEHVALAEDELTRDVELPEATGGVVGRP